MSGVFRCLTRIVRCGNNTGNVRFISSNALRDPNAPPKPEPWPYQTKPFRIWHRLLGERTTSRLDDNSVVVVVDGPVAAGKSEFARNLANQLGMLYFPEANLDMIWINDYGFDLRTLNSQIPESMRSYDIWDFCRNPTHRLAACFQIQMYTLRYAQYIDALAHVLSTGQGVVLDRCAYSDMVFAEAMTNCGWMSRAARNAYYDVRKNTISELMRPHLVVYLDVGVQEIQRRLKDRGLWYEQNSPALTAQYLGEMERAYKQRYLPDISKHAELLVYDWTRKGDVEVVVEDIERIDMTRFDTHNPKLADWRLEDEDEWCIARANYADKKIELLEYTNVPRYDVPELVAEADDLKAAREVWNEAPGEKYNIGFNTDQGDTGLLFKLYEKKRPGLAMCERIIPAKPTS